MSAFQSAATGFRVLATGAEHRARGGLHMRPSAADLSAIRIPGQRLPPPDDLPDDERVEWERITSALPPGFISLEQGHLLKLLVRHICLANRVAEAIKRAKIDDDPDSILTLKKLAAMQAQQTTCIVTLSQKLRLSNTSRRTREKTMTATQRRSTVPKPWLDWPGARDEPSKQS
jgi:hypothetical protein